MPTDYVATNAASSGITIDRKQLKSLMQRSDRPGLTFLLLWIVTLAATGSLVWIALDTFWIWPAMVVYGSVLTLAAYSMSHETAHGTAFRTRWLNETVMWITALIYMEEPLHRRYTHTNHHTRTWYAGEDSQMPFDLPMDLRGWLLEVSGIAVLRFSLITLLQLATRRYRDMLRRVTPKSELPKLTRNARIFLLIYLAIALAIAAGVTELLWFLVLPRLLGAPLMMAYTLLQHIETDINTPRIPESTRSFRTNWPGRFFYLNMNHHIEHHLYPQVPFYSLPALGAALRSQLPEPDPGFWRTSAEVLSIVVRRSRGQNTRARSIRQATAMITDGGHEKMARATTQ